MRLARLLRPFSSRNYRLYFGGQIVSLVGTWMTQTASLWLAYKLTGSPFLLGLVGFASQVPSFLLGPLAGVWVDRVDRYRLLCLTQFLSMAQSLALAWFALRGTIDIRHLLALSLLQGVINAFDMPVRQSLVVRFVTDREHLGSAIALNSSMFNMARLVGPALGGLLVAKWGAGYCYLFDGLSYVAVLAALAAMRLDPMPPGPPRRNPWHEFREGVAYAFGSVPIRALVLNLALVSFCAFSFATLAPVFARDVFHGDARTLGWLMSASAVGSVIGAVYLGGRPSLKGLGSVICLGGLLLGLGQIAYALVPHLGGALPILALVGAGGILVMASSNTLLQAMVDDSKRGRVMSLFTMAFMGTAPLGSLAFGSLAHVVGAPRAVVVSGLLAVGATALFWFQLPRIRAAAQAHFARQREEASAAPISEG